MSETLPLWQRAGIWTGRNAAKTAGYGFLYTGLVNLGNQYGQIDKWGAMEGPARETALTELINDNPLDPFFDTSDLVVALAGGLVLRAVAVAASRYYASTLKERK
jgi:hypothetical protein